MVSRVSGNTNIQWRPITVPQINPQEMKLGELPVPGGLRPDQGLATQVLIKALRSTCYWPDHAECGHTTDESWQWVAPMDRTKQVSFYSDSVFVGFEGRSVMPAHLKLEVSFDVAGRPFGGSMQAIEAYDDYVQGHFSGAVDFLGDVLQQNLLGLSDELAQILGPMPLVRKMVNNPGIVVKLGKNGYHVRVFSWSTGE